MITPGTSSETPTTGRMITPGTSSETPTTRRMITTGTSSETPTTRPGVTIRSRCFGTSPRGYHPPSSWCLGNSPRGYHPPSSRCPRTISQPSKSNNNVNIKYSAHDAVQGKSVILELTIPEIALLIQVHCNILSEGLSSAQ
jgi:hypothetical protein